MATSPTQPRTNAMDLNAALRSFAVLGLPSSAVLAYAVAAEGIVPYPDATAANNPNQPTMLQSTVRGRTFHTVAITGTFVADLNIEATLTGADDEWLPLNAAAISAPGFYTYSVAVNAIRVNVTSYTSGTITVKLQSQRGG